ncbi:MAG: urate hydroxylase PuuD [Polyangiaceae bacterium]
MNPAVQEWLNVLVRGAHVVAAIMWIGDSFLFMWLDSQLRKPERELQGEVVGELWMAHSGGFYEVIKRKSLTALPRELHWFKWESYTTWVTGFLLLIIVYWAGGRAMMVDAASPLSQTQAVLLSGALIVGGLVVYDVLCRTPLARDGRIFGVVGLALVGAVSWYTTRTFAPRAAFILVGAMLGTIMASNVFLRIIPAQKHMLAATREGRPVDTSYGARAKVRSTHNHYLTFPVLLTMLSNHFPSLFGNARAWVVLLLLFVAGAGLKYVMNFRSRTHPVVALGTLLSFGAIVVLTAPQAVAIDPALAAGPKVSFATAQAIVQTRCVTCHSPTPTNPTVSSAPSGVMLDTPDRIGAFAERIYVRSVHTRTMPLGNVTGMSDEERHALGAWIAQGADIHAPGPADVPTATAKVYANSAEAARSIFGERCMPCHGAEGRGDGPSASALNPKPRNYQDEAWQAQATDPGIAKAILEGGAAVGKSPVMPGNPDLKTQPDVVAELVKVVRGFRKH